MGVIVPALHEGSRGAEIIPQRARVSGQCRVVKKMYCAFYLTDLALILRALKVQCLIIIGAQPITVLSPPIITRTSLPIGLKKRSLKLSLKHERWRSAIK
ncbi:MAG: isochorismatase family protein [Anaerolineales bacterium]|nr:isochorismatase family protein [Anaerolineales bacterium]